MYRRGIGRVSSQQALPARVGGSGPPPPIQPQARVRPPRRPAHPHPGDPRAHRAPRPATPTSGRRRRPAVRHRTDSARRAARPHAAPLARAPDRPRAPRPARATPARTCSRCSRSIPRSRPAIRAAPSTSTPRRRACRAAQGRSRSSWASPGGTRAALVLEQLLVRALGEEAPMLARVSERIASASMLVTFNGKSFDMPLLRTRFVMARMDAPPSPPHLDLLHVSRRVHGKRIKQGCRLVAIERDVLGFERHDDVDVGRGQRGVPALPAHWRRARAPRRRRAQRVGRRGDGGDGGPVRRAARRGHSCPRISSVSRVRCAARGRSNGRARRPRRPCSAPARPSRCARGPTSPRPEEIARAPWPISRRWPRRWTIPRCASSWRRSTSTGEGARPRARLGGAGDRGGRGADATEG